ncbi:MAG: T9SS type A sorting domain-containing protein [Bacteroidota bacterium]|nr:T9SS type A sorting domain-containing protein [Bacteroidota bacterium]
MRKLTSFAAIGALALLMTFCSFGNSFAQIFNYTPYPVISDNQEDYYPDAQYLVPDALPGGERYFLVPIFIFNGVDPNKNPNTANGLQPGPGGRLPGIDGQFLEPIRSFEFQVQYPNQAIELDQNPAHGSPIMTVGPTKTSDAENSLATSFYFRYTEQSANDITNPFNRIIRVTAASEVPLRETLPVIVDSSTVLCYLRFHIIPNWTVNVALLQLDSAKFADHLGDPQYDPNNFMRGNLGGHKDQIRGRLPVVITAQPIIELRPFSIFNTTDGKNYDLLPQLVFDPADPSSNNTVVQLQIDNAQGSSRITNLNICTDQTWLQVGLTAGGGQPCIFFPSITNFNTPNLITYDVKTMFIIANGAGLAPGVYIGYVTMTSAGAGNSPLRIKVTFVVRARPNEPTPGAGTGIRLQLTNSCTPTCTRVISFGTGVGATDGVDLLYGEDLFTVGDRAAAQASTDSTKRCFAYFEPLNPNADPLFLDPNNLGTVRDFRSDKGDSTYLYKVDFGTGGPLCYPLSVCFDPTDLPEGSRFVIRDILNGSKFSFDMREATQVGNLRCITIRDASVSSFIIEYTPGVTQQTAALVPQNWNFISLPVIPSDPSASKIFPNSTGTPFQYSSNAGWAPPPADNLEFGRGYMIHYGTVLDGDVTGTRSLTVDNVRVHAGWNSVGAASFPTCISDVTAWFLSPVQGSNPKFETDFFEFVPTRGYFSVAYLQPGHGYFVKISDEGMYHVHTTSNCKVAADPNAVLTSSLVKVAVRDAAQNGQDLWFGNVADKQVKNFEMPPSFTDFDARFASNNGNISVTGDDHIVKLSSKNYPVAMNFENVAGTVEVRDLTGNLLGTASNGSTVVISDRNVKSVVLSLKGGASQNASGYSLEANYPNPFSTVTNINYAVPAESFVTITVTNALGQVVATPVNGVVAAGTHSTQFDATNLADGTYLYTIRAGNFVQTQKMTVTK